jgi:hypothetical protein
MQIKFWLARLKRLIANPAKAGHKLKAARQQIQARRGSHLKDLGLQLHGPDGKVVRDYNLDLPKRGLQTGSTPLGFSGWIVGAASPVRQIEVRNGGETLLEIPVQGRRPDILQLHPDSPQGAEAGFAELLGIFRLPERFELSVLARDDAGNEVRIATLAGRREAPGDGLEPAIAPVALTTLGRTGSSHALGLLGLHPQIAVYRPYQAEARYASYWLQLFLSLTEPRSWMAPLAAFEREDPCWVLGQGAKPRNPAILYPQLPGWFNGGYSDRLFRFCTDSMRQHYRLSALAEGKREIRFFCEKFLPDAFTRRFLELLPETREVILVRDFRDLYCSIRSFNAKRGSLEFGRAAFDSEEDYVREKLAADVQLMVDTWQSRRDRAYLLRYEDLVLQPQATLLDLYAHLGLDASTEMISELLEQADGERNAEQDRHRTVSDPAKSIGRFREDLEPAMQALCNQAFKPGLECFGYSLE